MNQQLLIMLNFFEREPLFELPEELNAHRTMLLISNYEVNEEKENLHLLRLRPYEARVYLLQQ
ncbi:Oligo-1,6-glucosidase [compost metagenome]